jgi:hypothetical protein
MQALPREPGAVRSSVRIYRFLVRLYPDAFRLQYGDLMAQAFRDTCLRAHRQNHRTGLLALWGRTLVDVLLSMIEQYSNRGAVMTKSRWIQISGWFMAASGLLFFLGWMATLRPAYDAYNAASWPIDRYLNAAASPLLFAGMLFVLAGILGLRARYGAQAGKNGQAGLVLSLASGALALAGITGLAVTDSSPWWQFLMVGSTFLFVGLGLFGVSCLKRRLLPRWNSLPLLVSIPWPLLLVVDGMLNTVTDNAFEMPAVIITAMIAISFFGIALVGYLLQSDAARPQAAL